ncbi:phage N-6-adenine-methyltransferase [Edwardsiella tarda]
MTIKSKTPAEAKDCWQTPLWLFDALDIEFGFWLDAASSDHNALCSQHLTESDNALLCDWNSVGAIWCNPPYSKIGPWVAKASIESEKQRQPVVMLVPEDMSVGWFTDALKSVDEVRVITGGRINFVHAVTGSEQKGNSKGSMLLIWRPFTTPRRMITTISKSTLEAIGRPVRSAA